MLKTSIDQMEIYNIETFHGYDGVEEEMVLRVFWIARRPNQSILKEISPEYSLEERADAEAETAIILPPDAKN